MNIQPIILAGGKGTRMESDLPKVLVPLAGKPLVKYLLDTVETVEGLEKPIVVVGYERQQVMDAIGDRAVFAVQEEQLGTGHAVRCALDKVQSDHIIVLYGDMPFISASEISQMIDTHNKNKAIITIATSTVDDLEDERKNLERYGRIIRENSKVVGIIEYKDATDEIRSIKELNPSYFIINTSWLKNSIQRLESNNIAGEYYLTDIVKIAIKEGIEVSTVPLHYTSVLGANTRLELEVLERVLGEK